MTKPAVPPPPARSDALEVEMDAMDLAEWESGQSTPQASDANLAELVRRTAATPEAGVGLAATRERARTQLGPAITARTSSQRARTAPPGPAPKPTRARAEGSAAPRPADAAAAAAPLSVAPASPPQVIVASAATTPREPTPPKLPALAAAPRAVAVPGMAPMPSPAPSAAPMPGLPPVSARAATPGVLATPGMVVPPVPAIAGKAVRAPATPPRGIDFSLPVTSTGERDAPPLPLPPPAGGIDFSLPVTSTGESAPTVAPGPPPPMPVPDAASGWGDFDLPVTSTGEPTRTIEPRGLEFAVPVTATSQSGARRPDSEPRAQTPSPFAEASHSGPGRNASPTGGSDPNTAWPPRPMPAEAWTRPDPAAAPQAILPPPAPEAPAPGAEQLQVLSRRRLYLIAGAIGGVAIAAVFAAASFGSSSETSDAPAGLAGSAGTAARDPGSASATATGDDDATGAAMASRATGAGRSAAMDPAARALSAQNTWRLAIGAVEGLTNATVGPAPRPKHRSGPTRVVLDYRARPGEAAPVTGAPVTDEDAAIDSARGAYNRGNQRLFVGDLEGAVRAYRESLDLYPGYVGGYRGLGLAYAELGEKTSAIEALEAYVAAAPSARDIALIKKRLSRLQGK